MTLLLLLLFKLILNAVVCCYLVVCSTTLWVGQLDKKTSQQDISSLLEEFGQIESINVSLTCRFNLAVWYQQLKDVYLFYHFRKVRFENRVDNGLGQDPNPCSCELYS